MKRLSLKREGGFSTVIILIFVLCVILLILFVVLLAFKKQPSMKNIPQIPTFNSPSPSTTSSFTPVTISPLQKTIIGQTSDNQVDSLPGLQQKQTLGDGSIEYTFNSSLSNRPNEIITKDGVAVFEREVLPLEQGATGYTTISNLTSTYGQPDKTVEGSKTYDWSATTYIYASKGFAFVGNKNDGSVFEVQAFKPMTVDDYVQTYGQDLNPGAQPPQEGGQAAAALANFEASLPYYSSSFSILYNRDTDATTVIIRQANKDAGLAAFNSYLSSFGITDSSMVKNLTIEYK